MFAACLGLSTIAIPNSVTNIGGGAFGDCFALTTVTIPEGVVNISGAFGGSGLTNIIIPDSVTNIDLQMEINCQKGITNNEQSAVLP